MRKVKITYIEQFGPGESGNGVMLGLSDGDTEQVCNVYMSRYSPVIGGYYIENDKGFISYEEPGAPSE